VTNILQRHDSRDEWMLGGEYITSERPFTVRRVTRWAECDPAGVVYVGNFPNFLLSAVHLFRNRALGAGWIDSWGEQGVQTPGKALSMVFQGSLWPDDVFDMAVYVGDIRTRTMNILVQATRADDGTNVFAGSLTSVFVTKDDRRKTVSIPAATREWLERHRAGSPPPPSIAASLQAPE
jgi:acyl-CoA thioesterase FadM